MILKGGGSKIRVSQLINTPAITNTFGTSDSKALMTKLHFSNTVGKKICFLLSLKEKHNLSICYVTLSTPK